VNPLPGRIFQAVPDLEDYLRAELGDPAALGGPFFYSPDYTGSGFFNRNVWLEPFRLEFDSIGEAARTLRGIQRNWAPALFTQFRRGALITEKLPPSTQNPGPFPGWSRIPPWGDGPC
jgi:23S rRNA (cytidine2498-2'-O)-methyltransferase